MVTFKQNFDIQIQDENKYQSGIFTFLKGKSYDSEYRKVNDCIYLFIYSIDRKVYIMFNKIDEERFLK